MAMSQSNVIQDAGVALAAAKNHATELAEVGITTEDVGRVETLITTLTEKDFQHKESISHVRRLTDEQNLLIGRGQFIIGKIQSAAKVQFFRNKNVLIEFHIGKEKGKTVAEVLDELGYMNGLMVTYASQLTARGIKEADLTELNACHTELQEKDREQENAKRLQVQIGAERNAALAELKDAVALIRQSAKTCFRGNKTILNEFKSILKARKPKTPDTPVPPENA